MEEQSRTVKITARSQEMAVQKFERDMEALINKHASEEVMAREELVEMMREVGVIKEI
jgi:hypothetical protein